MQFDKKVDYRYFDECQSNDDFMKSSDITHVTIYYLYYTLHIYSNINENHYKCSLRQNVATARLKVGLFESGGKKQQHISVAENHVKTFPALLFTFIFSKEPMYFLFQLIMWLF